MWNIKNNMEDMRRRKGKVNWGKSEGEMNHKRLILRNKLRVLEGRGLEDWVSLVVGIKEVMYCMEHWVWCINNVFWNTERKLKNKNVLKS